MTVELTKDKMDKKVKREAKKAERAAKKEKKAEVKKAKFLATSTGKILTAIEERNVQIDALQAQYEQEVALRGNDLRTWPMEVLVKLKGVAPYEAFGIILPEDGADTSDHIDYMFDPTKGFKPTIQTEPELIKPFSFVENLNKKVEKPKKDPSMTDEQFNALEAVFAKYLVNMNYRYEAFNGIYKLCITRISDVEEEYIIDDGSVLGGSQFSILANKVDDTIFVFADDPEIPEILRSKFYVVTDDCVARNEAKLFDIGLIYYYIDFSNTAWINGKDIDKKKLESNLWGAIQYGCSLLGNSPRMRFAKFESANSFELISDGMIKTPLAFINATNGYVVPEFRLVVKDNEVAAYSAQNLIGKCALISPLRPQ